MAGVGGAGGNAAVISPELVVIGTRRYRKAPGDSSHGVWSEGDDSGAGSARGEAAGEEMPGVQQGADGAFWAEIDVPPVFIGKLIGKRGASKQQLEADTGAKLAIPRRGSGSDTVRISGATAQSVDSARVRVEMVVDAATRSARPTHFVCIPLLSLSLAEGVAKFRARAVEALPGLDPATLTEPEALHLTLGTLKLFSAKATRDAAKRLGACAPAAAAAALSGSTRTVVVKGVDIMNDDPSDVNVLNARAQLADGSDGLQRFADAVASELRAAGVLDPTPAGPEGAGVKIHATLVNTRKARRGGGGAEGGNDGDGDDNGGGGGRGKRHQARSRKGFDATLLLAEFADFEFGSTDVGEVHLSRMSRKGGAFYDAEDVVRV